MPETERHLINEFNSYLRTYTLGECSGLVTKEYGYWHMSIAYKKRYPTWDDVAEARWQCIPADFWMVMVLPPPAHYVNLHENCFQLKQISPPAEWLKE
jgi:hypothetical protein